MRRILIAAALLLMLLPSSLVAKDFKVYGSQGGLAMDMTLPDGFDAQKDKCPMVILMHGIFSSKDIAPLPQIAKALAKKGIASIRFDFNGHWHSEGEMVKMTIAKELQDARAIYDYARALPYVTGISLLGHSQGGAVASMFAGQIPDDITSMVLLAPGSVIKEACQSGHFFGNKFDPANPPEFIKCFNIFKLGREYLLTTQTLDIYGTAEHFHGPVCLIHGDSDDTVPLWCSEKYDKIYSQCEFHLIAGENHRFTKHTKEVVDLVADFFERTCKK